MYLQGHRANMSQNSDISLQAVDRDKGKKGKKGKKSGKKKKKKKSGKKGKKGKKEKDLTPDRWARADMYQAIH